MTREGVVRYRALGQFLIMLDAMERSMSSNWTSLIPRAGFEAAWTELEQNKKEIQKMMEEVRYDKEAPP